MRTVQAMNLPPQSTIKATGRPVASFVWTDPRTGEPVQVNDFGDCDGIRKLKGFTSILAEQKREVEARRKAIEDEIQSFRDLARLCVKAFKLSKRIRRIAWRDLEARDTFAAAWFRENVASDRFEPFFHAVKRAS